MTPAIRAFPAEIHAALDRLDVPAVEREYWAQDEFLFIPRFLPPVAVGALLGDVRRLEPGDHMGYHDDTSYYRGARYTAPVGLAQDSSSRLQCRLHTRTPGRAPVELAVASEPGSLAIFNGDKVYHGVSPSREGERRVVYTMEYVTSQEMGRVQRLYSRALLRGRGRARDLRARAQAES